MSRTPLVGARTGALVCLVSLNALAMTGCLDRPIEPIEPRTTRSVVETLASSRVEKIDLILAIDNSVSMADKQTLLGEAVPELVKRLVNPRCIDRSDDPIDPGQIETPDDATAPCPSIVKGGTSVPTEREFEPVKDIHVGIISSSLGDMNGGTCGGAVNPDDNGSLLTRTRSADGTAGVAQTYEGKGFLLWDPDGSFGPESALGTFGGTLKDMVVGVGQEGCGYEMQLESMYRFLVDPAPYKSIVKKDVPGHWAVTEKSSDIDHSVLDQRANFLRDDSLVAVIMLSDENDCSTQAEGYGYKSFPPNKWNRGSSTCESSPMDKCCYTCGTDPPEGCEADPRCEQDPDPDYDNTNLRCWNQKGRFGYDTLYPVKRYVNALTQRKIDPSRVDLSVEDPEDAVDNPLLLRRPNGLVYFAGIVGVPWQALARKNAAGEPDLAEGYQPVRDLLATNVLKALAGNPDLYEPPSDPFMIESVEKRQGRSDLLGVSPAQTNDINQGERTKANELDEQNLQYACVFDVKPVEGGRDCDECSDGVCDNPVCEGTLQTRAKATPGLRQLSLISQLGDQGIAASVCPAQTDIAKKQANDYGYNPAVGAIIDALKDNLRGQQCLPFSMEPDSEGAVSCVVIESRRTNGAACACDLPGRLDPAEDREVAIQQIQISQFYDGEQTCFCEVEQLKQDELTTCQQEQNVPQGVDGWCYVDASPESPVGNPDLIECSDPNKQRIVRVLGDPRPDSNSTLHVWCSGESGQ